MELEYYNWLLSNVDEYDHPIDNYSSLLESLYSTQFYWLIDMDENRALDGMELRDKFALSYGLDVDEFTEYMIDNNACLDGSCSVLEMMIALAIRCDEEIMQDSNGCISDWFWIMIVNLNLENQDNEYFDIHYVDDVLETWMSRKYKRNGEGNIFYSDIRRKDFRKAEIWYQMNWYLSDHYL